MVNEKSSFPPKKCTVDKLVTKPADIEKVLHGKKSASRRNDRYADIGEIMVHNDQKFKIQHVYEQRLGDIKDEDALMEGYQNAEAYKQSILSIHPGMKWKPEMRVWVHEFEPVEKD